MQRSLEQFIGRILRPIKSRDAGLVWADARVSRAEDKICLESEDFSDGGMIPLRCAGRGVGENVSPNLHWTGVPRLTAELLLVVQDPDAPLPNPIVHLIAGGIPPDQACLNAGALNAPGLPPLWFGRGTFGRIGYAGPRPLLGHGIHRYVFQMLAVARPIDQSRASSLQDLLDHIDGHIVARGKLTGLYQRN